MGADELQELLQKLDPESVNEVGMLKSWMGFMKIVGE